MLDECGLVKFTGVEVHNAVGPLGASETFVLGRHGCLVCYWFTDQNPLRLSALGSGFEAASEPVSAFQIRKTDTGSDASAKPPPPVAELTAASPVKNYHPKQSKPAS